MIGVWLLSQWVAAGRPSATRLVELGPGRGTLTDDVLRVRQTVKLGLTCIKFRLLGHVPADVARQSLEACASHRIKSRYAVRTGTKITV